MTDRIGVLGAGAWGTTLAIRLAGAGHPVGLWARDPDTGRRLATQRENSRYLPGVAFPSNLEVPTADADLAAPHRLYVLAVPSAHLRDTLTRLRPHLYPEAAVLSVIKGIEQGTQLRMSEVIDQELPRRRVAILSGPNLAREIAAGLPAGTVIASRDAALAGEMAALFASDRFRVYTNPDVVGVELCGALKNVVALAVGMVEGLEMGDSAKAGIITRGLAEMTRLGVAAGAQRDTFAGLAGVGDLIATCMSPLSRNHQAGRLLGTGMPWPEVKGRLTGEAEGVSTLPGALALAARHGVEMPIAEQVAAVVRGERRPLEAVVALMARAPKDELDS
ncbi:MAG TPA: NAD(P)H-dependent glycerol-3-phosphate dehydrogenase [Candidatus Limnocylindria bacterium]|nr:NAD(P)H-dependent glycerol-3-phosphate dehydrogenase [Candidatus Limnocylindria bacterium]